MNTGQSKWGRWVVAVAMMVGLSFASVAWGKKVEEKVQSGGGDVVSDNGDATWRTDVKAEVGTQLLQIVEEVAKMRQDSLEEANPVLVAYEQLSREMWRWFTLFGFLGGAFGIIVPLIAIGLQIKAVDRHETHVEKLIQKSIDDAQNEVAKLIDIKVSATEREIDQSIKTKLKKFDDQISGLWKQHSIYLQMIVNELYQKLVCEWENNRDGVDIGLGLLSFCNLLDECAHSSGDAHELQNAASVVFRVFDGLSKDKNAIKFWREFSSKLKKKNKRIAYGFHFSEEVLGEEDYKNWQDVCSEWGIQQQYCIKAQ